MKEFRVYVGPAGFPLREAVNNCAEEAAAIGFGVGGALSEHDFVEGFEGRSRQCRRCSRFERVVEAI